MMGGHQGSQKEVACLRVTRKGLEGGRRQLGGDGWKEILVCLHTIKVGIREGRVKKFQGGCVVRCGFSVKVSIGGVIC